MIWCTSLFKTYWITPRSKPINLGRSSPGSTLWIPWRRLSPFKSNKLTLKQLISATSLTRLVRMRALNRFLMKESKVHLSSLMSKESFRSWLVFRVMLSSSQRRVRSSTLFPYSRSQTLWPTRKKSIWRSKSRTLELESKRKTKRNYLSSLGSFKMV